MTTTKRMAEYIGEEIRKDMSKKSLTARASTLNSVNKIARIVDKEAIKKCRLTQLKNWEYGIQHKFNKTDQYIKYEKDRDNAHRHGRTGAFHIGDLPVGVTVEKMYYDAYGEGFDGTDIPARLGEHYECWHCHRKFMMAPAQLPLKCGCGTETPLGRLVADGWLRR